MSDFAAFSLSWEFFFQIIFILLIAGVAISIARS